MNLQLTLAWRYLNGRKLRSFLTTLAVVFGVLVIFGMNVILPTMLKAFEANMMAIGGVVDATVTHKTGGAFSPDVLDGLRGIEDIRAISPSLNRTVNLPADFVDRDPARPDSIGAVNLIGVEPESAQSLRAYVVQEGGRFLAADDTASAVISQSLADAFGVRLGDSFSLPSVGGNVSLTVIGILPPRTIPGNEEVLVTLAQAQVMTGQAGQINTIEITLDTTDGTRRAEILGQVESALGPDYHIGALQSGADMFASIKMGQAAFNMFGVLALFMGGFIIFNTFRTVVAERRRDIGMLRALGAKRSTITGAILFEGLLQGLIGSAAGILLGYLFGDFIVRLAAEPLNQFVHINMGAPVVSPALVVTSILLGVGVTILSSLLPARSASRVTPMDALRPSVAEVEYKRRASAGFITGLVLTGLSLLALFSGSMGLVMLGALLFLAGMILLTQGLLRPIAYLFGKLTSAVYARHGIGDLAHGNLTRQPGRVAVTASATMIGLAIVVSLGSLTTSLIGMLDSIARRSLGSDYLFIPPSLSVWNTNVGADPAFAQQLQAIEGVGDISTLRFAGSLTGEFSVSVLGIDPKTYPRVSGLDFLEGDESSYAALAAGRSMIVNGAFAMTTGYSMGDSVELLTPSGPQTYTIAAVATDLLDAKVTTVFISQENLAADFGRSEDVFIQLNLEPGVALEDVDAQIKAIARDYPQFTVIAGKSYIDDLLQMVQSVFVGMYFMLAFLAFPSFIAMLNTLVISVIERTREIGMIRAVGGTRKQVRRMVTAEALLLASVGTAFGILSGMYLGYAIVKALEVMFPMAYVFPLAGILAGIAIGLIFGALAAVIPARQAARLQVVEALRYE
ncbi:MAG: FtsX-like permease family protein [Chloroflexota bacterium]